MGILGTDHVPVSLCSFKVAGRGTARATGSEAYEMDVGEPSRTVQRYL